MSHSWQWVDQQTTTIYHHQLTTCAAWGCASRSSRKAWILNCWRSLAWELLTVQQFYAGEWINPLILWGSGLIHCFVCWACLLVCCVLCLSLCVCVRGLVLYYAGRPQLIKCSWRNKGRLESTVPWGTCMVNWGSIPTMDSKNGWYHF